MILTKIHSNDNSVKPRTWRNTQVTKPMDEDDSSMAEKQKRRSRQWLLRRLIRIGKLIVKLLPTAVAILEIITRD